MPDDPGFYFIEPLTSEGIKDGEVYIKTAGDHTEVTNGRATTIEEELDALKKYNQNPEVSEYFPEPLQAIRNREQDLLAYTMEFVNTETPLEYSLEEHPRALVEDAISDLEYVIQTIHEDPELPPHGNLIGNTFFDYGNPMIISPKGIPKSTAEENQWEVEDQWQLEWLEDNSLPDDENIIL